MSQIVCCDRGYDRPSGRPRVSKPAPYYSSTPRIRLPAVTQWQGHLHGLATPFHEISGLGKLEIHSVNLDFRIPEEKETMVARMLFVSQLTLSHLVWRSECWEAHLCKTRKNPILGRLSWKKQEHELVKISLGHLERI